MAKFITPPSLSNLENVTDTRVLAKQVSHLNHVVQANISQLSKRLIKPGNVANECIQLRHLATEIYAATSEIAAVQMGTASAAGALTTLTRGDHVHLVQPVLYLQRADIASWSASQNNLALADATHTAQYITSSAAVNLTGIAGGVDGYTVILTNRGANTITLTNEDALSTAANRFHFWDAASVPLLGGQSIILIYDSTLARWRDTASAGGDVAIGAPVIGGTANDVLYIGSTGLLAQSANLTFDGTTLTLGSAASISFSTNPATTGRVRLPNLGQIMSRNAANTLNLAIAQIDASNVLNLGDGSNSGVSLTSGNYVTLLSQNGAAMTLNAGGTGTINFQISGVTQASMAGTGAFAINQWLNVGTATGATTIGQLAASSLTANSFLYSGVGGLLTTTIAPTNGQLLIGSTGAAPVAATITQGTGLVITNGAGSITAALTVPVSIVNGGTNQTAFTSGSVIFYDGTRLQQNNASFFWDNVGLGLQLGSTAFISFATNPATAGRIRLPNNGQIISRNFLNSLNIQIAVVDASNVINLGDGGSSGLTILSGNYATLTSQAGSALTLNAGGTGTINFQISGVTQASVAGTGAFAINQWLNVGTTTDAAAQGSFSSGLTGASRMTWTQATPLLALFNGLTATNLYPSGGFLGINTSTPRRRLDILDAINPQLRLTFTDNSVYTDLQTKSDNSFNIIPVAGNITFIYAGYTAGTSPGTNIALSLRSNAAGAAVSVQLSDNVLNSSYISMVSGDLYIVPAGTAFARFTTLGSTVLFNAALATTAVDGFLYIASMAGAPTGVPTAFTGRVPMVYDSTNNNFYIYNGGWKKVSLL